MPKPPKVIGMGAANSDLKLRILFGNCIDKSRLFHSLYGLFTKNHTKWIENAEATDFYY